MQKTKCSFAWRSPRKMCLKLLFGHPKGGDPNLVYKLCKFIYGQKQSLRVWYAKLSVVLRKLGFKRNNVDHYLFVHTKSDKGWWY